MASQKQKLQESPSQAQMQEIIEQRVNQARKEEMLGIYENLLQTTWDYFLPILGQIAMMEIGEQLLTLTKQSYPVAEHLQITCKGIYFAAFRQQVEDEQYEILQKVLKTLFANLIDIVTKTIFDIFHNAR